MARSTRSEAAERAYRQFAPATASHGLVLGCPMPAGLAGVAADEFDESDIWGESSPAAVDPRAVADQLEPSVRAVPTAARARRKPAVGKAGGAAHGSLPVNIPDWSKILGDEYRGHHGGDWELDADADDEDIDPAAAPPHELAWRRRAASLSVHEVAGIGRTLKVRDAVWKKTGFQA